MGNTQAIAVGRRCVSAVWLAWGLLLPVAALAADAHKSVQAKPGEIVLLRNVSAHPAYRQAPPGVALIANPSPVRELDRGLGTGELSDADYASLDASIPGNVRPATTVERALHTATDGSLDTGNHRLAENGAGNLVSAPIGTVVRTTGNINNQIQGALSQLPGMPPSPSTGGH